MLKLLLKPDREELKKEYFLRFLNMFLAVTIFGVLTTGALMSASYFMVHLQEKVLSDQIAKITTSKDSIQTKHLKELSIDLKKHLEIFNQETPKYSGYISKIQEITPQEIDINSFSFKRENMNIVLELRGHAKRREDLVGFVGKLRSCDQFDIVDLPLSNLVKESDINFVINMQTKNLRIKQNYE